MTKSRHMKVDYSGELSSKEIAELKKVTYYGKLFVSKAGEM
jgi:hypothetical protein